MAFCREWMKRKLHFNLMNIWVEKNAIIIYYVDLKTFWQARQALV